MKFLPALVLATALVLPQAGPATAQTEAPARTVTVTGSADVAASPDRATISVGVVSEAKTAAEALDANNEAVRALLARLKEEGLESRDLRTSGFSVQPQYVYPPRAQDGAQEPPRIVGYSVSNSVTARLRDLARLGDVLDAAIRAGANQVQGISFDVADADKLSDEARKAAVANARRKAELYAAAAGASLGPVVSISETAGRALPPMPQAMRMEASADSVPVETGEQTLHVDVEVVWELAD